MGPLSFRDFVGEKAATVGVDLQAAFQRRDGTLVAGRPFADAAGDADAGNRFGPRQIRAESCLIRPYNMATGAAPFVPPLPGLDDAYKKLLSISGLLDAVNGKLGTGGIVVANSLLLRRFRPTS